MPHHQLHRKSLRQFLQLPQRRRLPRPQPSALLWLKNQFEPRPVLSRLAKRARPERNDEDSDGAEEQYNDSYDKFNMKSERLAREAECRSKRRKVAPSARSSDPGTFPPAWNGVGDASKSFSKGDVLVVFTTESTNVTSFQVGKFESSNADLGRMICLYHIVSEGGESQGWQKNTGGAVNIPKNRILRLCGPVKVVQTLGALQLEYIRSETAKFNANNTEG